MKNFKLAFPRERDKSWWKVSGFIDVSTVGDDEDPNT